MANTDVSDARAGRLIGGRYRLDTQIASGGMATVWQASDEILARSVAVKILHAHLARDASFVERFRREAIAAARLAHPSIVQIFDTCSDTATEAIVMELVRGVTLRHAIDEREDRTLDAPEAIAIVTDVADALACAHGAGIVHRDVKPGNILLSHDGRVLVTDFGIAKAAEGGGDLTQTGMTIGTVRYLAPEQVDGGTVDARSDVYSLGVVLYELLCGRPPFDAPTPAATALARLHRDPLRPRQVRAGVPRALESIILRAIARDPAQRFQSAADLRDALRAAGRADELDDDGTVVTHLAADVAAHHDWPLPPDASPTPPAGSPRFTQTERGWLIPTLLIVLISGALVVAGVLFTRSDAGRQLLRGGAGGEAAGAPTAATFAAAQAFDPQGSGGEHDEIARQAIDGDVGTAWRTEEYNNRRLGGLKDGVGLIVELEEATELATLVAISPTRGWSASVYVAGSAADDLAGWGEPVASDEGIDGDATFELRGTEGRFVLIWITDLGESPHRVELAEVQITV